ncbi:hypothetical protein ACFVDQ_01470 [Streptomyces sp. NPDC057684]|uniref:hypothetical protein n=1 Tax=Streptomyces sp. NPDC057684 TaxID=3346211 RepID=UPI0036B4F76B
MVPLVIGRPVDGGESAAAGYGNGFLVLGVAMITGAVAALLPRPSRSGRHEAGRGAPTAHRRPRKAPKTTVLIKEGLDTWQDKQESEYAITR